MIKHLIILSALIVSYHALAVGPVKLTITTVTKHPREEQAKKLLEELVLKYQLEKYFFTTTVNIEFKSLPHSHPVLSLNTRTIDEPERFMAVFVHEQIHRLLADRQALQQEKFIELIKKDFPVVPKFREGGASDERSTYIPVGAVQ